MYPKITKTSDGLNQLVQSLLDEHPEAERLIFPNNPQITTAIVLFRHRPQLTDFHNNPAPASASKPPYRLASVTIGVNGHVSLGVGLGIDLSDDPKRAQDLLASAVKSTRSYEKVWEGSDLFFLPQSLTNQAKLW